MERAGNGSAKIDGCPRQNPAYRPDCLIRNPAAHSACSRLRIKVPQTARSKALCFFRTGFGLAAKACA